MCTIADLGLHRRQPESVLEKLLLLILVPAYDAICDWPLKCNGTVVPQRSIRKPREEAKSVLLAEEGFIQSARLFQQHFEMAKETQDKL